MNEVVGVVDFFDRFTGRGQILGGDRRLYWTHRKELVGARVLQTGQRVVFTATEAPRGPRARRAAARAGTPAGLMARRGRPTTADTCRDPHARRGKILLCRRRIGHRGDHGHGTVTWSRRIEPPPPGSSFALSPPPPSPRA